MTEIDYTISKEELIDFHMGHVEETKVFKYQMISNFIFIILVILLGFLVAIALIKDPLSIVIYIVFSFIIMLFRKKIIMHKLRKKFFKIYSFDKYQNLFEQTKLTFVEEGLKVNTKFVVKIYNWNSIKSIHSLDNYILVRTVNNEDLLIPIFSFKPIENIQIFLDTIINNTNLELEKEYPKDIKYL